MSRKFYHCHKNSKNRATAEDIVQDIFIKVFYSLHKYKKWAHLMHGYTEL